MRALERRQLYRLLDANLNRAREGLRVCEDICRFILDERSWTKRWKALRHDLTRAAACLDRQDLLQARSIQTDVGKASLGTEQSRKDPHQIMLVNMQRVKESLRVLEEFLKIFDKNSAENVKKIRYKVYRLEQSYSKKFSF
ncbi:MAG: thiamine-phosphate pyrophosphorylase [Candidatus Omnitrophota bacterium]